MVQQKNRGSRYNPLWLGREKELPYDAYVHVSRKHISFPCDIRTASANACANVRYVVQ